MKPIKLCLSLLIVKTKLAMRIASKKMDGGYIKAFGLWQVTEIF